LRRGEPFRNASQLRHTGVPVDPDVADTVSELGLRDHQYRAARSRRCDLVKCFTR